MIRGAALLGILAGVAGCRYPSTYACGDAAQCVSNGEMGVCEPEGFCSFPDSDCESGRRFGELAGDGLAGQCTDPEGDTSSTATATATVTSVGSTLPTSSSADAGTSTSDPDTGVGPETGDGPSTGGTTMGCEPTTWYPDADGDGFGDPNLPTPACEAPADHVEDDTDCDDSDPRVNPDGLGCPLSTDLVAWYRFDEAAGASAIDDAAGDHDGAVNLASADLGIVGVFGGALTNDGTGYAADLAGLADTVSPDGATLETGTIEAWVRVASAPASIGIFVYIGSTTGNGFGTTRDIHLHAVDNGGLRLQGWLSGEDSMDRCTIQSSALADGYGEWFHLAFVWDNDECQLYVDGVLDGEASKTSPAGGPLEIARLGGPGQPERFLSGDLDELMVWRSARTAEQVISDCGACP